MLRAFCDSMMGRGSLSVFQADLSLVQRVVSVLCDSMFQDELIEIFAFLLQFLHITGVKPESSFGIGLQLSPQVGLKGSDTGTVLPGMDGPSRWAR